MIRREGDRCLPEGKCNRHVVFLQSANRNQVDGNIRGMETIPKGPCNGPISKCKLNLDITNCESREKATVGSLNGHSSIYVISVEKTAIMEDMVGAR
jgi:hypothetical protein